MGISSFFGSHFMFFTSLVALVTAGGNLLIIYWISMVDGLDSGLGLAAIGIVTFCGTLLSSSIFEEHRHDHGSAHGNDKIVVGKDVSDDVKDKLRDIESEEFKTKLEEFEQNTSAELKNDLIKKFKAKKSNFVFVSKDDPKKEESGHFIESVIAGTGIMRKSLAASLVVTYIVLIGLSFSAGTLDSGLDGEKEEDSADKQSILGAASHFIVSGQFIDSAFGDEKNAEFSESVGISEDSNTHQKSTITKTATKDQTKSVEQLLLEKNPKTLIEHFTIVITVVIGFYFGSNTLKALLNARKEDHSNDTLSEINKKLKGNDEITNKIKEKLDSNPVISKTLSKDAFDAIDKLGLSKEDKLELIKKMLT